MSELNPLNDLSRIYLDKVALMNRQEEQNDVERWQGVLDDQMEKSSKELATLGAPTMEEEKKAAKDYDGDGKVESGKEEYFGSKDKAIKKAMKKEEVEEVDEAMSAYDKARKAAARRAADRNAARRRGELGGRMERETYTNEAGRQMHHKGYRAEAKRLSNWREDLSDLIEVAPMTDVEMEKEVTEKKVNNKVVINPKMSEAVAQIGGEVISETEVELQEKHKDTPDQVKAVIAYDRARKGTDDATYDSMHGKKKQAKKERDYAKWQRDKGAEDAQKSGHPWEHAKGSTREKEGKKSEKHAHIKDSFDPQREEQLWDEIAAHLTEIHERGGVKFKVVPFDANEEKNWIQGAVKRPGAFTKKAKAAGMSVQQFAKHVDANKDKYSTRTERQANLAQTFSKMKKEGADYDALSSFLVQEGADDQAVNYILANWVEDVCLGKS